MPRIGDQYRIITGGAGWRRRVERGRVRFRGADRASFLQALLTNEIDSLAPGAGTYAAYLTPQGRMIADLVLFVRADEIIATVPSASTASLVATFDRSIFSEDVQVEDISSAVSQLTVVGGGAADLVSTALGLDPRAVGALATWSHLTSGAGEFLVAATDDTILPSFDVIVPAADEERIADLLSLGGAEQLDDGLWTALRIDAGRPLFGRDMNDETIPLEAGLLERAISTEKGCYVGQEVIVRVLHRGGGRVVRRLMKLSLDSTVSEIPADGTQLRAHGKDVGRITSAATTPDGFGVQALAYVHRDFAEAGRLLALDGPGMNQATVVGPAG